MKKGINKKIVIFHPFAQKPPSTDLHQIWRSRRGRRRNHLYQFFGDWSRGVYSVGVENCHLPLTKPVAAARDGPSFSSPAFSRPRNFAQSLLKFCPSFSSPAFSTPCDSLRSCPSLLSFFSPAFSGRSFSVAPIVDPDWGIQYIQLVP